MPDFFEQPVLNTPYEEPGRHWELLPNCQPTQNIKQTRRPSSYLSPIPRPQSIVGGTEQQLSLDLGEIQFDNDIDKYNISNQVNAIRQRVRQWRDLPKSHWKVTPETTRLLQHWRNHKSTGLRPFFCQIEAIETLIWLTEVAPHTADGKRILARINMSSELANPGLLRLALKMATGAGKTTVMAMIIAWQTINAVRHPRSPRFTKGFLVVTPGLTVRDRLRVLQPNDPDSYYQRRELVPMEMMPEVRLARIVITNYHAFMLREKFAVAAGTRRLLEGRTAEEEFNTLETEGQMLQRVMPELMGMKQILVMNDEAHHCSCEKPQDLDMDGQEEILRQKEDKEEADKNNKAARVWISGLQVVAERIPLLRVVDLSATPFFLQGSGYAEGTLFPWTVSDFSLMDAIECGIVKLPRVPVAENIPSPEMPQYRNIWENIRKEMPKMSRSKATKAGIQDPRNLPIKLQTALDTLYNHYFQTFQLWEKSESPVPPCFIVVCQNTAISGLVYQYLAGGRIQPDNPKSFIPGKMALFRNYREDGTPLPHLNTILIDSEQLDSGNALSKEFLDSAQDEIARFKREIIERTGDIRRAENLTNEEILREVMNTIGKPGTLGSNVRCVVSVSMLTEGWDANTVTHICGIRAFGTQLLCEQVIGRALRRQSYELNEEGLFPAEYADIFGIPFDFAGKPTISPQQKPADTVTVKAIRPERDRCEIRFPRVVGYRKPLETTEIHAEFTDDSILELTTALTGPTVTRNAGIIGKEVDLKIENIHEYRLTTIEFHLSRFLLEHYLRDHGEPLPLALFGSARKIVREWMEKYLVCRDGTFPGMLIYHSLANMACKKIQNAIIRANKEQPLRAILSPYNPVGTTAEVQFVTSKKLRWRTNPNKCHLNYAICDSQWEIQLCRKLESDDRVLVYVRNHGLGFDVPYSYQGGSHSFLPDFLVRYNDGHGSDDTLYLILEVKGQKDESDKTKRDATLTRWIPGVNNLHSFGRWKFVQIDELYQLLDWKEEILGENH
ncbi:MAG: DEAD/DEAH box helicase family protein [Planctomycetia bacterium]|nr:DEAD/DEAH box helicase family protein [Planctomycetia bacterium]